MENVRYNISPCSPQEALEYISKIDETVYVPRGSVKADERSHYDRYAYVKNDSKVAVVYDTFAHVVSVTASKPHADELLKLFAVDKTKTIKTSTVPAQGGDSSYKIKTSSAPQPEFDAQGSKRAKIFVDPKTIRRSECTPMTVIATAKGAEISTDEIYPPQRAYRKTPANNEQYRPRVANDEQNRPAPAPQQNAQKQQPVDVGMNISLGTARSGVPRRATISFGDEDDYGSKRTAEPRPVARAGTGIFADITTAPTAAPQQAAPQQQTVRQESEQPGKRKRGRPPKNKQQSDQQSDTTRRAEIQPDRDAQQNNQKPDVGQNAQGQGKRKRGRPPKLSQTQQGAIVTALGYAERNEPQPTEHTMQFSRQNMAELFNRLKKSGTLSIVPDTSVADVVAYMVSDRSGQKVSISFTEKQFTLRILGIYGELFKSVRSYAEKLKAKNPVVVITPQRVDPQKIDVSALPEPMKRLYRRIPTAFAFLSDQSRADFAGGMHDFSQSNLNISDYSGLLVQPFRALEKFIFDLQRAEGIQVKMIGQAYDKDDRGNYILKRGYQQRIGSVVYAEVMVALYTEYFLQRNFFAHSDNTDGKATRSISDRASANRIFEHLLDVVEYNARKLREIGFSIEPKVR